MDTTINLAVSIPQTLFEQLESLAQRLGITPAAACEIALAQFIASQPEASPVDAPSEPQRIQQGAIYWVLLDDPRIADEGIPHPHVIVQADVLNNSRITTVVACALTSNMRRASLPGNVVLAAGEANLPKASVVEASKVTTLTKTQLGDYIGTVSAERVTQILVGMRFLQTSFR